MEIKYSRCNKDGQAVTRKSLKDKNTNRLGKEADEPRIGITLI